MVIMVAADQAGQTSSSWLTDSLVLGRELRRLALLRYDLGPNKKITEASCLRIRILIPGCMIPCMVGCASNKDI